ncbi:MAG: histidine kinase [Segetibacter sp.]
MCEDENGFLWAGTDKGLCRYDGFSWQVYDKDNGLPGNYINKLYANKRGGLWMDIGGKGFFNFNIATGKTQKDSLPSSTDKNGNLFSEIHLQKEGITRGYLIATNKSSPPHKVYEYKPDSNFIMTADANSKKVLCFIKPGSNFNKQTIHYKGEWNLIYIALPCWETIWAVYLRNDLIVITTTHYYRFSKEGKLIKSYALFKNSTYAYSSITKKGCYVYDIRTGYYFINNKDDINFYDSKTGLGSDYVNQVYEMKDGTIAFATLGAGLQFIKNDYRKSYPTGNRIVRSIVKSQNYWYVLAGEKVFTINQTTSALTDIGSVKNSALNLFKTNEHIVIGSLKGIDFYTSTTPLRPVHFIPFNAGVSSIMQIKNGFIASTYGNGLIAVNTRDTNIVRSPVPMRIIEKTLPLLNGYASLSYEDGVILTDTVHHKNIHLTQEDGLLSNSIQSVHQYRDTIWISTKAGINIYTKGRIMQAISYNQGFTGSKAVYCFHDKKQQLWVVGNQYLHLYDGQKLKAITSHPLVSDNDDFITSATYDALTNTLATGSLKNISIISLDNIQPDTTVTIPRILQVIVDEKIQPPSNFKVPYKFQNIAFRLAPYASSPLSRGKFFYNLKGSEDSWKELQDSLSFSYAVLRPGSYKLKAKIINPDGYESRETLLASFVVNKPFWLSWWFLLLLLITTILITTYIVKRVEVLRRRKKDAGLLMQQTLQNERERISKDLHDHLGSNLVTIVAQVDNIETKLHSKAFAEASLTVQHLSHQTREVMNVLRETIWAVQENEHSLESFAIRIRTFLQRLFESCGISWQLKVSQDHEIKLSPKQTLHLFRIIQEATQNIIKHSRASEVNYLFHAKNNCFEIIINDNGVGLNGNTNNRSSNGLFNMQQRVRELNGTIVFETKSGTVINIEIPVAL